MKPDLVLHLSLAGTPAAPAISMSLWLDGKTVVEGRLLTPVQSSQVKDMAAQYFSLFSSGRRLKEAQDYFDILGKSLFHLFLEDAWEQIGPEVAAGARLVVASEMPEILSLPWEHLHTPEGALGQDPRFSIRRAPGKAGLDAFLKELSPGPLRVLFMSGGPEDFQQEEAMFLRSMQGLDIWFEMGDLGSFQELEALAEQFRPHLVHLCSQCRMKGGAARLSLEGPGGRPDLRSAEQLGKSLSRGGVQLVICSGSQTEGPAAQDLLAQDLAGYIPLVVAWNGSSEHLSGFYRSLSGGEDLDVSLDHARREIGRLCQDQGKLCALPVLYTGFAHTQIFDSEKRSEVFLAPQEQHPLSGISEGYCPEFADRRRDRQRLLTALSEGAARSLIITGPPGAGKSTLGAAIAHQLSDQGYLTIPVYSSGNNPLSAARILEAGIKALAAQGLNDMALRLRDPEISRSERQKIMMEALNKGRFLLVLDGLRLDEKSGRIKDPELSEFYKQLLRNMEKGRAIVTCNALPADMLTLPSRAWEWPLQGLPEAGFARVLLRDRLLAERYRKGELTYARLEELYTSSAGLPACLWQIRPALAKSNPDLNLCSQIFADLYRRQSPEEQAALIGFAVHETAITADVLAESLGIASDKAQSMLLRWKDLYLANQIDPGRWIVPQAFRSWLLDLTSSQDRIKAHRAAGAALRNLAEAGRSRELKLSRLDVLMESRGQYLQCPDLEAARQVTSAISSYLERRGYYYQIILLNRELADLEEHPLPLSWIARAYMDQGRYLEAQKYYSQALDLGPDAMACHGLGSAYMQQGKLELAFQSFSRACEICRSSGDLPGQAAALHGLASIDLAQKKTDSALEKLQMVLAIQERLGDLRGQAATLSQISSLHLQRGGLEEARQGLVRSAELLRQAGDRSGESAALFNLASLDLEGENFAEAEEEFKNALALKREVGDRRGQASILHSLGTIHSQAGEKEQAMKSFLDALRIYQDLGDKPGEAGAFFQLGALAVQEDRIAQGLRLMALSAVILRSISSEEVKNVEPVVERLASQLNYSQEQFMAMVKEVITAYRRDEGASLLDQAFIEKG